MFGNHGNLTPGLKQDTIPSPPLAPLISYKVYCFLKMSFAFKQYWAVWWENPYQLCVLITCVDNSVNLGDQSWTGILKGTGCNQSGHTDPGMLGKAVHLTLWGREYMTPNSLIISVFATWPLVRVVTWKAKHHQPPLDLSDSEDRRLDITQLYPSHVK